MPEEELGPSICPELSSNVIQTILEINAGLIKVCVEFQNKGWTSDPDFAIYQARLQSNLAYLAAVADHYLKPDRKLTELPPKPNLTPLPDPRTVSAQMLKKLVSKAKNDFESVDNQSLTKIIQRDIEAGKDVDKQIKQREEDNKTTLVLDSNSTETFDLPVPQSKRVLDPPVSSENYQNYQPFPPLQLPEGVKDPLVPPNLPVTQAESDEEGIEKLYQLSNNDNDEDINNNQQIDQVDQTIANSVDEINEKYQELSILQDLESKENHPAPILPGELSETQLEPELNELFPHYEDTTAPQSEAKGLQTIEKQSKISLISELIDQINNSS